MKEFWSIVWKTMKIGLLVGIINVVLISGVIYFLPDTNFKVPVLPKKELKLDILPKFPEFFVI
jgi:hypothetical protein